MYLVEIFCAADDFCKQFERNQKLLTNGSGKRNRAFSLSLPEILTILIYFHSSGYKTFKEYYEKHVLVNMKSDFSGQVSYNRFIELKQKALMPLMLFAHHRVGATKCTGISFIDSFPLKVCHNRRIHSHTGLPLNMAKDL